MVYGCRKVDHVFERSISVDAIAAGEQFMVRFAGKIRSETMRGRTWPLGASLAHSSCTSQTLEPLYYR